MHKTNGQRKMQEKAEQRLSINQKISWKLKAKREKLLMMFKEGKRRQQKKRQTREKGLLTGGERSKKQRWESLRLIDKAIAKCWWYERHSKDSAADCRDGERGMNTWIYMSIYYTIYGYVCVISSWKVWDLRFGYQGKLEICFKFLYSIFHLILIIRYNFVGNN